MSSAEIRARAAKLTERRPSHPTPSDTAPAAANRPRPRPIPRARPVRVTTDLAPQTYRQLITYCAELAETFGQARVPHTEVIRALVDQLATDPALRRTIADAVHEKTQ